MRMSYKRWFSALAKAPTKTGKNQVMGERGVRACANIDISKGEGHNSQARRESLASWTAIWRGCGTGHGGAYGWPNGIPGTSRR